MHLSYKKPRKHEIYIANQVNEKKTTSTSQLLEPRARLQKHIRDNAQEHNATNGQHNRFQLLLNLLVLLAPFLLLFARFACLASSQLTHDGVVVWRLVWNEINVGFIR